MPVETLRQLFEYELNEIYGVEQAMIAALEAFARDAPALAFSAHAGEGGELPPAPLGRDEARCRAEGCGWVGRCYDARRGAT